jgi:hypothetical protein
LVAEKCESNLDLLAHDLRWRHAPLSGTEVRTEQHDDLQNEI